MSEEKKAGRPAKKPLPKGYFHFVKTKLEIAGYNNNVPKLQKLKEVKTVVLSQEQADELNAHKANTLIEYVKK